ncbi:MAG: YbfB/YjiJ family MFS transporter [Rhodoferax sp.]
MSRLHSSRWLGLSDALALALAPLVALGFTRFAYALLLPPMQHEFAWSFARAGALNTSNALGYLVGALMAAWLAGRYGLLRSFTAAMVLSAFALVLTALPSSLAGLMVVRGGGGFTTAVAFVLGTSLAIKAMPQQPATALSIYFAGSGLGIVLAGTTLPWMHTAGGQPAWRMAWIFLGALTLLATLFTHRAARTCVQRMGPASAQGPETSVIGPLWPSLLANVLYGAGYVGYMTFMIALLQSQGAQTRLSLLFFAVLGGASMAASAPWGALLTRLRTGDGFALVSLLVALGSIPALLWKGPGAALASALLFGACFMAGPAAISLVAQRTLSASGLTWGLALLTAAFSLGQSIGPVLAGWISDNTGSLQSGLWLGPVLLVLAAGTSLLHRRQTSGHSR